MTDHRFRLQEIVEWFETAADPVTISTKDMRQAAIDIRSLFPEGRSEQDQGGVDPALAAAIERISRDVAALETPYELTHERLSNLYRPLTGARRAFAADLRTILSALLSSAQGETKEGFDGLPELPCGERDEPTGGATAALAGWRPIDENTPKRGVILGAGLTYGPSIDAISWGSTRYDRSAKEYLQGWTRSPGVEVHPTHWMPLPAAPDAAALVEGE